MTLLELSTEYRKQGAKLKERLHQIEDLLANCQDRDQRFTLEDRKRSLSTMYREAQELAVLTERYYERGYRRNGKYTL